jgi:hypothetical protein
MNGVVEIEEWEGNEFKLLSTKQQQLNNNKNSCPPLLLSFSLSLCLCLL